MTTAPDGAAPAGNAPGVGPTPPPADAAKDTGAWEKLVAAIGRGNPLVIALSFLLAFVIGSLLIIIADQDVREAATYFFARPQDTLIAIWDSITQAYLAMLRGSIIDYKADSLSRMLRPLTETLTVATPLIIASCGMAVGFRAGLFNIGGTGQLIVGAMAAGYVGFTWQLPVVLHLLVALAAGVIAGGIWGGIAGFLKARFEANEVISTIMLNWIATYLLFYALKTDAFTGENKAQPTSPSVRDTASLPGILGDQYRLHLGLLIALGTAVLLWWLMSRSTLGFRFRAVGSNPRASEVAGISTSRASFGVLLVAGALVGLAGAVHILGTEKRLTDGIAGSIGFDAITVALLGASGPVGIVLAGLLFAALSTGGRFMETTQQVPLELVQVIQALVVLFIAAPPLVRTIFGMNRTKKTGKRAKKSTAGADGANAPTAPAAEQTVEKKGAER